MKITVTLPPRFLSRAEVMKRTALASATLTHFVSNGSFPAPHNDDEDAETWKYSDVMSWIKSRQHRLAG